MLNRAQPFGWWVPNVCNYELYFYDKSFPIKKMCERVQLTVFAVDDLKVLDRRLCDPTVEVEYVRRGVIIPNWSLVVQLDQVVQMPVLVAHQQSIITLHGCAQ